MSVIIIIIIIITVDRLDRKDNIKLMMSVSGEIVIFMQLPSKTTKNRKGRTAKSFILE